MANPAPTPTTFLIADISGYTGYLADVELDHAQDILADLIGAVVSALRPDFRLAKLEGDAAFTFTPGETDRRIDAARHDRALLLRLPAAPPRRPPGDLVRVQRVRPDPGPRPQVRRPPRRRHHQKVAGREELLGSDVIVVAPAAEERRRRAAGHRRVRAAQPGRASMPPGSTRSRSGCASTPRRTSTSARSGAGSTTSSGGGRRRRRASGSSSPRRTPILVVSVPTGVPPQVAWEFLTTPGQRMRWQPWVTEVDGQGRDRWPSRPRIGQPLHARQGRGLEEILDWRPTTTSPTGRSSTTPTGPLKLPHTIEFEPTPTGTDDPHAVRPAEVAPAARHGRAAWRRGRGSDPGRPPASRRPARGSCRYRKGGMGGVPEPALPIPDPDGAFGALGPTPAGHGGRGGS